MIECWYQRTCKQYKENCQQNCIRYIEMKYMIDTALIPKGRQFNNKLRPSKEDIESFKFLNEIKKDIVNFINNSENLYIFSSKFGNGKTTWAIKLMQNYFNLIWAGNGLTQRGLFIHVPSFLTKFKEIINKKDESFEELKKQLLEVDLVIWDDIAAGKLTDYDHNNLLVYIDQRKLNGKSNIYTGNLNEQELIDALGNRLKSRVWNDSTVVELRGTDRRDI